MPEEVGYTALAASGVVGDSGLPVAIYGYSIRCGTAAAATFKEGAAVGGTAVMGDIGTANQAKTFPLGYGVVFPTGAYCSFATNVTGVTVFYRQVRTA